MEPNTVWVILGKSFVALIGFTVATKIVSVLISRGRRTADRNCLAGKIVLITGASSGLGQSLAVEFYKAGCKVLLAARNVDKLKEICDSLKSLPKNRYVENPEPEWYYLDLTDRSKIAETAKNILSKHDGNLDILINNAGTHKLKQQTALFDLFLKNNPFQE